MSGNIPSKATPNPLALHGTHGRLIVSLQRYGLLGWGLFVALLVSVVVLIVVSTLAPRPVVAVDASGRVLGTMEFLQPSARSQTEIEATAVSIAHSCLSLTAETIADDLADCLNIMADPLQNKWLAMIKDGYMRRIQQAGGKSYVTIPSDGVQVMSRKGLTAVVQVHGKLTMMITHDGATSSDEKPFAIEMTLTAIPRTSISTRGFRLDDYKDINI